MKNIVLGILAHVDAGKTTMSEAMLFRSGAIRTLGRVDHKDAYLDTFRLERERGITIFSKQAVFEYADTRFDLLDTPGHMDFSAEMERTLSVLDYAILVISGPDGVQAHTRTLWQLLQRYSVPCFIWINKMDLARQSREDILRDLKLHLGGGCIDLSSGLGRETIEALAEQDEAALEEYLSTDSLSPRTVQELIRQRKAFPCFFGSALKLEGVDEFLDGLDSLTAERSYPEEFGAKVFKITRDEKGQRLSWLKITGGSLRVRQIISSEIIERSGQRQTFEEKIGQIRIYSGSRSTAAEEVPAGHICAVLGLEKSYAGQGLGFESNAEAPELQPVLSYGISLPDGTDIQDAYAKLLKLAEEDPMLRIVWNAAAGQIQAQFMGPIQIEVLKQLILDRYGLECEMDNGRIVYMETIAGPVEGIGHFEPLRHYAEVHLLMEPLPRGSGIVLDSSLSTDILDLNWQRLVLTHLAEKPHIGVLTGSPITDIKMTLVAGRAHLKHTEGGDFRQASYRAVRNGLMKAENILLEPWYDFTLELPSESIGRAISDLQAMSAEFDPPVDMGLTISISGKAPVSEMQGYTPVLLSYTKGRGRLSARFAGYFPCHNTARVIEEYAYEAERDTENSADSVFCSHGSGIIVPWDKVAGFAHIDSGLRLGENGQAETAPRPMVNSRNLDIDEKELEAIMQREFGEIKKPRYTSVSRDFGKAKPKSVIQKADYYIVDGYNLIFAWDELKEIATGNAGVKGLRTPGQGKDRNPRPYEGPLPVSGSGNFEAARQKLITMLANYAGYTNCSTVLIFDGYKVKEGQGSRQAQGHLSVVYTREGESADSYIEKLVHEIGKNYSVKIVSSDGMIQLAALQLGVLRVSAREYKQEVEAGLSRMRSELDAQAAEQFKLEDLINN